MKRRKDPLANLTAGHADDPEDPGPDRLARYRAKCDAAKTPEPVAAGQVTRTEGLRFVVQEHHARRLHYDFRLEHDGVLVSWALPKGVPTDVKKNHLAVQTEDNPLEYGSFEGHIPEGEYGAREVTTWDTGSYELEKWREGEEVIVTLHGEPSGGLGGPKKIAGNWLIHLMKDPPSRAATATKKRPTHAGMAPTASRKRFSPMLATLGRKEDISEEDDWAFEMKWDGIRASNW